MYIAGYYIESFSNYNILQTKTIYTQNDKYKLLESALLVQHISIQNLKDFRMDLHLCYKNFSESSYILT
jgi:hypothetical protein